MALSKKTLNITTFSIMTLSITTICHYARCHYDGCRILFIVKLNVIVANVVMLSVVALFEHRMGRCNNFLVPNTLAYLSEMAKKSFERFAPENKGRVPFRT